MMYQSMRSRKEIRGMRFITRNEWSFSLLILFFIIGCDNYEIVIDELSQREANEALVLLRDRQIDAHKVGHTVKKNLIYQIKVKKSQSKEALRLLVYYQIPKIYRAGLKEIYPPGSSGLIPTKSDELARLMMAIQGEVEALLKVVPGIADARIVLSYDPPADFNKTAVKKTASVALIYQPQQEKSESPLLDQEIKNLVAASISGLLAENVTVIQKMMAPIDWVSTQIAHSKGMTQIDQESKGHEPANSPWYLMVLTIGALTIAAYAVLRIFLQKRYISM
jgi:type III secretion system YscJ/HrcJ family lipoprotein